MKQHGSTDPCMTLDSRVAPKYTDQIQLNYFPIQVETPNTVEPSQQWSFVTAADTDRPPGNEDLFFLHCRHLPLNVARKETVTSNKSCQGNKVWPSAGVFREEKLV